VTIQDASLAKGSWRSVYVVDIEASGLGGFRYRFTENSGSCDAEVRPYLLKV